MASFVWTSFCNVLVRCFCFAGHVPESHVGPSTGERNARTHNYHEIKSSNPDCEEAKTSTSDINCQ